MFCQSNPGLAPTATEEQCHGWAWEDSPSETLASINVVVETQGMKTVDYSSAGADLC